ncbi:MAG: tetratricopeptide repeat protein [Polyangiaceae bacterium]
MNARAPGVFGALLFAVVAGIGVAPPAWAQPAAAPASPEDRRQAAHDFAEGDHAFKEGDFRQAAESYERAYHRVPHHSALWNAARAWHRAGELARAANLYARYLREAPPTARDRNSAQRAVNDLSNRLARLEIHATDVGKLTIDGEPLEAASVYVTPGAHVVEGRTRDDKPVREAQTVEPGDVISIVLVPPSPAPPKAIPPALPRAEVATHGWSPVTVYFGGALTLALAGITVWSGLDTLQQKDAFDRSPTQNNLDVGHQKQTRTNVLVGATAGVAALTAAVAFVLVDWHAGGAREKAPAPGVQVGAGLGSLVVKGAF